MSHTTWALAPSTRMIACPSSHKNNINWGLATLLEGVGCKKVKVFSKNVLNYFLVDYCCKVGVNYGFNSELKHQSWCHEKKKC